MTRVAKEAKTKKTARATTTGERKSMSVMTMMAKMVRVVTAERTKISGETSTMRIRMIMVKEAREALEDQEAVPATQKTIGEISTMRR